MKHDPTTFIKYLKENEFHSVVVFFGNGLIDMFGSIVLESLKEYEIALLDCRELDSTDINDIVELACECKFSNCRHLTEPGCAVKKAVEAGEISEKRFKQYLRLRK